MSNLITEGANIIKTNNDTQNLNGQDLSDTNSAGDNQSNPVTSEEAAWKIKTAIDPLTKQLELLCNVMKEFCQDPLRRSKKISGLFQVFSRAPHHRSDT